MKKLILLITTQILVGLTASADANAITQWEDAIPLAQNIAINMINDKASDLAYRDSDSGVVCGGETAHYELADYYTEEDYDGIVTHDLSVRFYVTVPVDFCATQAVRVCETKFKVTSEDDITIGDFKCIRDVQP